MSPKHDGESLTMFGPRPSKLTENYEEASLKLKRPADKGRRWTSIDKGQARQRPTELNTI